MHLKKSFFIYISSIIIIAFGVLGLTLSTIGLVRLNNFLPSSRDRLSSEVTLNDTITSVTRLMEDTSIVLKNASLTLDQIEESLIDSQKLLEDTSKAFFDIADTVNFEILGYRPLEKTHGYFKNIGNSLSALSYDLGETGKHLKTNSVDLLKTSESMDIVSINTNKAYLNFSESLSRFSNAGMVTIFKYLLVYIMVLHLIFILIGLALILK